MSRHWIVKKDHERLRVIVYSIVGMAILMGMMMLAGLSATK
jgi:hypothetical protein